MSERIDAINALIASQPVLPPPVERERLRKAHGLSQEQVAAVLGVRRATLVSWEQGKTDPRPPQRSDYAHFLRELAKLYPTDGSIPPQVVAPPTPAPVSAQPTSPETVAAEPSPAAAPPSVVLDPTGGGRPSRPASPARRTVKKTATHKPSPAAATTADPRFANGPLAVIDAEGSRVQAYCVGGLVLDVPAMSLPALVEWALSEGKLGAPRLHRSGKDADPLLVLTAGAVERFGLPARLSDDERRAGRLPEGHQILQQLESGGWLLTKRGFGPWARVYRPAQGNQRFCVQLCILPWGALDQREWDDKDNPLLPGLMPGALARVLGTYATRVLTPRGTTAVTGLELMTALHPPTRAVKDEQSGAWTSAPNPGALTEVHQHVPCEVPDGHPLLADLPRFHQRTEAEMLMEEAYDWGRPLTDDECMQPYVVGIDVNMAFAAAANRLTVGLGAPVHLNNPAFDAKLPGSWLVDLSHITLDERLPSPFTRTGTRPTGPAWYATPTLAYALELGYPVTPIEAYIRTDHGPYLDAWYTRLRDAYIATMADLGVTAGMDDHAFLKAMADYQQVDPELALVLRAIKATVKGGIGKLRERPRGGWRPGQAWPALSRPTWRPDIRAAVISAARVNLHRKIMKTAAATGVYPVAIATDCIVYPSPGPSPRDFLPRTADGKPAPGTFRLGVSPGMVKHEGTQTTLWAEEQHETHGPDVNIARTIKNGGAQAGEAGE